MTPDEIEREAQGIALNFVSHTSQCAASNRLNDCDCGFSARVVRLKRIILALQGRWRPIETAPRDRVIEVYAPAREGFDPLVSICKWHPGAGFCIDEIRNATHWREHVPPAPEGETI